MHHTAKKELEKVTKEREQLLAENVELKRNVDTQVQQVIPADSDEVRRLRKENQLLTERVRGLDELLNQQKTTKVTQPDVEG